MKNRNRIVIPFIVGIFLLVAFIFTKPTSLSISPSNQTEDQITTNENVDVQLRINDMLYSESFSENQSVLELMNYVANNQTDFSFTGTDSDFGYFVDSINEIENNSKSNDYWSLYVNDQLSEVGVSEYIIQDNDIIEWKYEHVEF